MKLLTGLMLGGGCAASAGFFGGSPQNRPGSLVDPQSQDRGLGMTETGSGCAERLRSAHAAGSQGLHRGEARLWDAAGHTRPSDGVTYDISQSAPEGCVSSFYVVGVVVSFAPTG